MLTLREMSDRLEIQELFARYAHAVDSRDWVALKEVFTEDAVVDRTAMGGRAAARRRSALSWSPCCRCSRRPSTWWRTC
jgi:hypothetical protein